MTRRANGFERRDHYDEERTAQLASLTRQQLTLIGEDPSREGLVKTPERFAKSLQYLTQGYEQDPHEVLRSALFHEEYSEMVVVRDVEFYSLCEHHVLPFFGRAHVAYIPKGVIVGLSKLPRVVDIYARRLQVQERLTWQILRAVDEVLSPLGAAVVLEAQHMCMMMRGAEKQTSRTTTSAFSGAFANAATRNEFMRLIGH